MLSTEMMQMLIINGANLSIRGEFLKDGIIMTMTDADGDADYFDDANDADDNADAVVDYADDADNDVNLATRRKFLKNSSLQEPVNPLTNQPTT